MSRTVLVTGGLGFVGRQVVLHLQKQGFQVRLVLRPGQDDAVASAARVERILVSADLFQESQGWWQQACSGVDTVIHLAWCAKPGLYLEASENLDCLGGTLQLAAGCALAGVRRFVGIGTCFEYDLSHSPLAVDTPLNPASPYAAAKAAAFLALSRWFPMHAVAFAWCRLFYLYGDGENPKRLVPYIRSRLAIGEPALLGSGQQVRDYLDVKEAAARICEVALGSSEGAINVCSGNPVTVRQLAEEIADEYGRRDLLQFGMRKESPGDPACVVGVPTPIA